jgi:hypothetical protein
MNFSQEKWRVIPSLAGLMASNMGRIMVSPYFGEMPNGRSRQYGGHPTTGQWTHDQKRYIYVHKGKSYKVARMVCEAFHGEPIFDRAVCMHLNENPRDNRPENLAWGTQKENLNAIGFISYCRSRTGENSPNIKSKLRKLAQL